VHGFARARCGDCGHDFPINFFCKARGVRASCYARRMMETAAHLDDQVLPDQPLRPWVLAVPRRPRCFLEREAGLQGAALRLFLQASESHLRTHSQESGRAARLGAVVVIHCVGSSLNAHLHFHWMAIDGVFDATAAVGLVFHAATGLDTNAIAEVQAQMRRRLLHAFMRRGLLPISDPGGAPGSEIGMAARPGSTRISGHTRSTGRRRRPMSGPPGGTREPGRGFRSSCRARGTRSEPAWWRESDVRRRNRSMLRRTSSADFAHTKGFGSALYVARYRRIAHSSSQVDRRVPRRTRLIVRVANRHRTGLSHAADVGVKRTWKRGCRANEA